jgi:hypothetical protein
MLSSSLQTTWLSTGLQLAAMTSKPRISGAMTMAVSQQVRGMKVWQLLTTKTC